MNSLRCVRHQGKGQVCGWPSGIKTASLGGKAQAPIAPLTPWVFKVQGSCPAGECHLALFNEPCANWGLGIWIQGETILPPYPVLLPMSHSLHPDSCVCRPRPGCPGGLAYKVGAVSGPSLSEPLSAKVETLVHHHLVSQAHRYFHSFSADEATEGQEV